MKKNIKKLIFSLALAAGLALGTAAVCSFASDYTDAQGVQYDITSYDEPRTASVASNNRVSGGITIPATITVDGNEYAVTTIGDRAFCNCRSLTSIEIPPSVTTIGDFAFSDCRDLTSITIPSTVTTIRDYVFQECDGLTDVYVEKETGLGYRPFDGTDQNINVWRYRVNETAANSEDGKTHVTITSVKNRDESVITTTILLVCNAMGDDYVIDAVECCATGNAEDGWTVYGVHDLNEIEAVDPTCTEAGNSAYWTCSHCGKHFSDADGQTEIAEGDWVIAETGHAFGTEWYSDENSHWRKCIRCDATSDEAEHNWGEWHRRGPHHHWKHCRTCNKIVVEEHEIEELIIKGDADRLGKKVESCKYCKHEREEMYIEDIENTCPSQFPDGTNISDELKGKHCVEARGEIGLRVSDEESVSDEADENIDENEKKVEIILQDPLGVFGGKCFRIELSDATIDLGKDYDGGSPIENSYKINIELYLLSCQCDDRGFAWEKKTGELDGYVRLLLEIPDDPKRTDDDWDDWETQAVRINEDEDTQYKEGIESQLYEWDGSKWNFVRVVEKGYTPEDGEKVKKYIVIWTNHFSKYGLVDPVDEQQNSGETNYEVETTAAQTETTSSKKGGLNGPKTGENTDAVYILAGLMSLAAVGVYLTLRKRYSFN